MSIEMWRADDGGRAVLQSRLQRGVFDEFVHEPTLDAADIRVVVDGRVVTLLGTVKRYPDKLAAERAAKRVRGVQMVRDELEVMPSVSEQRTDWEITLAAMQVLESHVLVPRDRVQATVAGGWVALAGEVSRGAERRNRGERSDHGEGKAKGRLGHGCSPGPIGGRRGPGCAC